MISASFRWLLGGSDAETVCSQSTDEWSHDTVLMEEGGKTDTVAVASAALSSKVERLNREALKSFQSRMYEHALSLLREAAALHQAQNCTETNEYARCLNNLALVHKTLGHFETALHLNVEALNIRKKAVGTHHLDYAVSLNNLATLYVAVQQPSDAIPLYKAALKVRRKALGSNHPEVIGSMESLAIAMDRMGDLKSALPLLKRIADARLAINSTSKESLQALDRLGRCFEALGDTDGAHRVQTFLRSSCKQSQTAQPSGNPDVQSITPTYKAGNAPRQGKQRKPVYRTSTPHKCEAKHLSSSSSVGSSIDPLEARAPLDEDGDAAAFIAAARLSPTPGWDGREQQQHQTSTPQQYQQSYQYQQPEYQQNQHPQPEYQPNQQYQQPAHQQHQAQQDYQQNQYQPQEYQPQQYQQYQQPQQFVPDVDPQWNQCPSGATPSCARLSSSPSPVGTPRDTSPVAWNLQGDVPLNGVYDEASGYSGQWNSGCHQQAGWGQQQVATQGW